MQIDATVQDLQALLRELTQENMSLRLAVMALRRILAETQAELAKLKAAPASEAP